MAIESLSRRGFLRGRAEASHSVLRPPWALVESEFLNRCTRCNKCVEVCPTSILFVAEGGFPSVDFQRGECTFCAECVTACSDGALQKTDEQVPWHLELQISDACIAKKQVVCQSCGDVCEVRALHFRPQLGGVSLPILDADACTGCGACINTCPVMAISAVSTSEMRKQA